MEDFRKFQKQLLLNYFIGSLIAVFGVGSVFIFHTLDLPLTEIIYLLLVMLISILIMVLLEITLFKKHIRPLKYFFEANNPTDDYFKEALGTAHRFPLLTVQRILGPHLFGLSIPASLLTFILIFQGLIDLDYYYIGLAWVGAILIAIMHALIEFFLTYQSSLRISRIIVQRAKKEKNIFLTLEGNEGLSLKVKLLISSLFTAIFPVTLFILASQIRSIENQGGENYWSWASLIILVIFAMSITTAILLFKNIEEPIQALKHRFDRVAVGDFEIMDSTYSDEFAHLVTGFNSMVRGIQDRDLRNEQLIISFFSVFAATLDARDPYTAGHSSRVADYVVKIAKKAQFSERQVDLLKKSALLHDIGKIGIRDDVLLKESRLNDDEFDQIKQHPVIGAHILNQVELPDELKPILPGVKYHHERYDGGGYPEGLKGNEIPLFGRILGVADAFDAMTSDRPYVKGMSFDKALKIIRDGRGAQFDPYYANLFLELMEERSND
ncbi:HD domain-containing phosphohydrolase [Salipaludibacillus sp. HK11]|uniref:HD domain-containing phosphohydrolase n=1 Tax=Salipaludibacillus sp. HK11 TaxID=3394320 RepID=UPI0039FC8783